MDTIDRINCFSLWIFRLIPIGILYLLSFHYKVFGMETTIIESLILAEYYLLVIVKFRKYEIAEGPLALLLFQFSIVVYTMTELNIISVESSIISRIIAALFLISYTILSLLIAKGFVLHVKELEPFEWEYPSTDISALPQDSRLLLSCYDEMDNMQREFTEHRCVIDVLSIPILQEATGDNPTPFVDYLKTISGLPNQHPSLASLEQFFEIAIANQQWDEMFSGLNLAIETVVDGSEHYIGGLKTILSNTKSSILDYVQHPNSETSYQLFHNTCKLLSNDFHSSLFHLQFIHAEGLQGKAMLVMKKFATDSLKGGAQTFLNSDSFHGINEDFLTSMHTAYDEVFSSVPHELDIDIFSPDFDESGHFPFITTAIEAFRLADKWRDGDIDMVSAAEKSAIKITGTAGGAYMGGVIGTLICPGVGTAVGAMVGGWLGRSAANSINRQELERLQSEYESEYNHLLNMAETAKSHIQAAQKKTVELISFLAKEEYDEFEKKKESDPFDRVSNNELLLAVNIIIREYIQYLLASREKENLPINELLKYLPKLSQIRQFPRECLELMLSVEPYIKDNCDENFYYDFDLIKQSCIEIMVYNVALYKTLQCTWYTEMYDAYKNSVSNILSGSNEFIKEYVDKVRNENDLIDTQKRIVQEAEDRVTSEARTL